MPSYPLSFLHIHTYTTTLPSSLPPTFFVLNTNRYANKQRMIIVDKGLREWLDLLIEELYIFIRVIIYIGVHKEP
jgi:hypothetical protein